MTEPQSLIEYQTVEQALQHEKHIFSEITLGNLDRSCFIWTARQCLVVPMKLSNHPNFAEAAEASMNSGWPVYVRQTGGGVTPQGPGILNVSLAFANNSPDRLSIKDSYHLICDPIITELEQYGIEGYCASVPQAFCDGDYNIVVGGKKLIGTAQRQSSIKGDKKGQAIFTHALMLYDSNLENVVGAVNRFYQLLDLESAFIPTHHCNFIDLQVSAGNPPSTKQFSDRLHHSFDRRFQQHF